MNWAFFLSNSNLPYIQSCKLHEIKHLKILFLHILIYRIHFNIIINLNKT